MSADGAMAPERVRERIFRVPLNQGIPEGWRFLQWLGKETNMLTGAWDDVVLCEVDPGDLKPRCVCRTSAKCAYCMQREGLI